MNRFDASYAVDERMKKMKRKNAIVNAVAAIVEEIWKGKGLPLRSHKAVCLRVDKLVDKVEHVKISKRRHETDSIFIEEIGKEHDKVFDISEEAAPEAMEVDVEPGLSEAEPVEVVVEDLGKRKITVPDRFLDAEVISSIHNSVESSLVWLQVQFGVSNYKVRPNNSHDFAS